MIGNMSLFRSNFVDFLNSNIEAKKMFFETHLFPGEKGRNSPGDLAFDDITNFNAQVSHIANRRAGKGAANRDSQSEGRIRSQPDC